MDDNVMKKYTLRSDEARHYVQYDQGIYRKTMNNIQFIPYVILLYHSNRHFNR